MNIPKQYSLTHNYFIYISIFIVTFLSSTLYAMEPSSFLYITHDLDERYEQVTTTLPSDVLKITDQMLKPLITFQSNIYKQNTQKSNFADALENIFRVYTHIEPAYKVEILSLFLAHLHSLNNIFPSHIQKKTISFLKKRINTQDINIDKMILAENVQELRNYYNQHNEYSAWFHCLKHIDTFKFMYLIGNLNLNSFLRQAFIEGTKIYRSLFVDLFEQEFTLFANAIKEFLTGDNPKDWSIHIQQKLPNVEIIKEKLSLCKTIFTVHTHTWPLNENEKEIISAHACSAQHKQDEFITGIRTIIDKLTDIKIAERNQLIKFLNKLSAYSQEFFDQIKNYLDNPLITTQNKKLYEQELKKIKKDKDPFTPQLHKKASECTPILTQLINEYGTHSLDAQKMPHYQNSINSIVSILEKTIKGRPESQKNIYLILSQAVPGISVLPEHDTLILDIGAQLTPPIEYLDKYQKPYDKSWHYMLMSLICALDHTHPELLTTLFTPTHPFRKITDIIAAHLGHTFSFFLIQHMIEPLLTLEKTLPTLLTQPYDVDEIIRAFIIGYSGYDYWWKLVDYLTKTEQNPVPMFSTSLLDRYYRSLQSFRKTLSSINHNYQSINILADVLDTALYNLDIYSKNLKELKENDYIKKCIALDEPSAFFPSSN